MLPPRSPIQRQKTSNPEDEKIFSTYQDEYSSGKTHGNLIAHYGNNAFINIQPSVSSKQIAKPFVSPSYLNLTNDSYINNRISDNYSNNYKSSEDNFLKRPITAPVRTKLDHLFKQKTNPISKPDQASIYENEYFNKHLNDHFVSKKWLKTETINLRDTIACLMELGDYMRNKSYDVNQRKYFQNDQNGVNYLDIAGQMFSKLISKMEDLLLAYNKLSSNSFELKKNTDNLVYPEKIIDRNIWDRNLRPNIERDNYSNTEYSIYKDKEVLSQQKLNSQKILKEAHLVLNSLELFVHKNLEEVIEEAKIILMHKLHNASYEKEYLRDSNGYIKQNAKLPMKIEDWLNLANVALKSSENLVTKSNSINQKVIEQINKMGENLTKQWLETHQIASLQVEEGLANHSKLLKTKYNLNEEMHNLNNAIHDAKLKQNHLKTLNEVYLTQLETKLSKIDPYYNENRENQANYTNKIWSNATNINDNINKMIEYKNILNDRRQRLETNILSNHTGTNYDLKTIVDPRRYNISTNPSIGLVYRSENKFL